MIRSDASTEEVWILVTREGGGPADALRALEGAGFRVRYLPVTRTLAPSDPRPFLDAIAEIGRYDWVLFTSPRAVSAFAQMAGSGRPAELTTRDDPRYGAVGSATAAAILRRLGREPDLVPERTDALGLAEALLARPPAERSGRVLFPAAENAGPTLPDRLRQAGIEVDRVVAYRTVPAAISRDQLEPPPESGEWAATVFASGGAVRALAGILATDHEPEAEGIAEQLQSFRPVTLGPSAVAALREYGAEPWLRSPRPTMDALTGALIAALNTERINRAAGRPPVRDPTRSREGDRE